MNLFYFDQNFKRNIFYNLALEEAICLNLLNFGLVGGLRFWKNENSIVVGLSENIKNCIKEDTISEFTKNFEKIKEIKHQNIFEPYISRRSSGGGTVYHDNNSNINYSIFISLSEKSELYPIRNSYQKILSLVSNALQLQNIEVCMEGKSDLVMNMDGLKKKISGNAQFRKKNCLVHHGTILLNSNIIEKIERHLLHPKEEPGYRESRNHRKFISSLPQTFSLKKFKEDLFLLFTEFMGEKTKDYEKRNTCLLNKKYLQVILKDTKQLYKEKYSNKEFIFGEIK